MTTVAGDRFEELVRMTNDRRIEIGALRDQIGVMAGELYDTWAAEETALNEAQHYRELWREYVQKRI